MNRHVLKAFLIAAIVIAGAFGLAYLNERGIIPRDQHETLMRAWNITTALVLVWWANLAPKRLRPLAETSGDPGAAQSARRFTSTAILIGGLLSALDWFIAPFHLAMPLQAAAIGGALAIAFTRCLFARARR